MQQGGLPHSESDPNRAWLEKRVAVAPAESAVGAELPVAAVV